MLATWVAHVAIVRACVAFWIDWNAPVEFITSMSRGMIDVPLAWISRPLLVVFVSGS